MNSLKKLPFVLILLLTIFLAFPSQVNAQGPSGDQVVFGGTYTLDAGEVLSGNLAIFGGSATLEEGSTVRGDIVITGGSLQVNGEVDGEINTIGGSVYLSDTAVVHSDIISVGGSIDRAPGATIEGSIRTEEPGSLDIPWLPDIPRPGQLAPRASVDLRPVGRLFLGFFQVLAMAALAVLVALFLTVPTLRVANAITVQPVLSGAIGLLTIVVAPALLVMLAITIILSPVALLGILVLLGALVYGWIALGLEIGRRMAGMFRADWTPPVSAGVGTLALSFVTWLIGLIPCIGWLIVGLVAAMGLGGVVLTRFGSRAYTVTTPPPPAPVRPAPPAVVVPPTPPTPPAPPAAPVEEPPAAEPPAPGAVEIFPVDEDEDRPTPPEEPIP